MKHKLLLGLGEGGNHHLHTRHSGELQFHLKNVSLLLILHSVLKERCDIFLPNDGPSCVGETVGPEILPKLIFDKVFKKWMV